MKIRTTIPSRFRERSKRMSSDETSACEISKWKPSKNSFASFCDCELAAREIAGPYIAEMKYGKEEKGKKGSTFSGAEICCGEHINATTLDKFKCNGDKNFGRAIEAHMHTINSMEPNLIFFSRPPFFLVSTAERKSKKRRNFVLLYLLLRL